MPGWETVDEAPKPQAAGGWETVTEAPAKPKWLEHPIDRILSDLKQANEWAKGDLSAKKKEIESKSFLGQMVPPPIAGMTQGVIDTVSAPAQLITHAMGSNAMDAPVNALEQNYQQNMMPSAGGRVVGQTLPLLATMGGSGAASAPTQALTTAQKVKAALAGIGKTTATGAVAAPALTPETGVQGEGDYWARKGLEAKTGAIVGGALGTAGQVIGGVASKLKAPMSPEAQAVQDLGDKFGVRTLAPDLAPPGGMAKAAVLAESVPGSGMVNQRLAQQAEAQAAAQSLLERHGIKGEIPATIQQGLKNKFSETAQIKNVLYDQVADAAGTRKLGLPKTLDALQAATTDAQASGLPENSVQKTIDTLQSRLYQGRDEAGRLLPPAADTTFTGMQKTRSDLNDEITKLYKSGDDKGARILRGVKDGLNQDMQDFATKSGDQDLANKWKTADSFYRSQYAPLKDKVLQNAVKNSEPDQIYKTIVAAGPDRAQKFYNALDSDGQAAVRSQMVQNAMDAATSGAQPFSPAKFAQSLEKIGDSTGVFFNGQDKFELDGFTNLMRHVQRAGQVGENPTNGQRVLQMLIAGEGVGSAASAVMGHPAALVAPAASVASANALTRLFASNVGKRLLLSASSLPPGSPAMTNLIEKDIPRVLSLPAASNVRPLNPPLPTAASTGQDNQVAQTEPK